jgi:hypothetical protein
MKKLLGFVLACGLAPAAYAQPATEVFQVRGEQAQASLITETPCEFGETSIFASDAVVHSGPGAPVGVSEVYVDFFRVNFCEGFEEWGGGWTDAASFDADRQLKGASLTAGFDVWVDRFVWGPPPPPPPPPAEGWTCDPFWYGDGLCDCGCGVVDADCEEPMTIEQCEFDACGLECGIIDELDPTQCIPAPEVCEEPPPDGEEPFGVADEEPPPPGEGEGEGEGEPPFPPPPGPGTIVHLELDVTWLGFGETYRGMNMSTNSTRSSHTMFRSMGSFRQADVSATIVIDGSLMESSFAFGSLNQGQGMSVFHVTTF